MIKWIQNFREQIPISQWEWFMGNRNFHSRLCIKRKLEQNVFQMVYFKISKGY